MSTFVPYSCPRINSGAYGKGKKQSAIIGGLRKTNDSPSNKVCLLLSVFWFFVLSTAQRNRNLLFWFHHARLARCCRFWCLGGSGGDCVYTKDPSMSAQISNLELNHTQVRENYLLAHPSDLLFVHFHVFKLLQNLGQTSSSHKFHNYPQLIFHPVAVVIMDNILMAALFHDVNFWCQKFDVLCRKFHLLNSNLNLPVSKMQDFSLLTYLFSGVLMNRQVDLPSSSVCRKWIFLADFMIGVHTLLRQV